MNQKEKETSSFPSLPLSLDLLSLSLSVGFFLSFSSNEARRPPLANPPSVAVHRRSLPRACQRTAPPPARCLSASRSPRRLCSEPPLLSLRVAIGKGKDNGDGGGENPAGGDGGKANLAGGDETRGPLF